MVYWIYIYREWDYNLCITGEHHLLGACHCKHVSQGGDWKQDVISNNTHRILMEQLGTSIEFDRA